MPTRNKTPATQRRRLSPDERRREIVEKAVEIFAENGLDSSTHELARALGVTQPLLYRYFPNKESLIREVYKRVYLDRWQGAWDQLLCDRSQPLRARLQQFYESYTAAIFSRKWMRIYLFSGLRGADINRWYIDMLTERVLKRIVSEFRHDAGLDDAMPPTEEELERAWFLHSGIFYMGVREHVYGLDVPADRAAAIAGALDVVFDGMTAHLQKGRN